MSQSGDADARRVGVRDVARLAGVSSQTVSRVINDHPNIRPETRAKVLDAMAALDYRVNNAARALGTRTTRTLGVIASDATLYGPAVGIAALEAAARAAGRWVATTYADAADEDVRRRRGTAPARSGRRRDRSCVAPHARTLDLARRARRAGRRAARRPRRAAPGGGRRARRRRTSPTSATGGSPASPARRTGSRRSRATRASTRRSPRAASSRARAGRGTGRAATGAAARGRGRGIRPRRRRPDGGRRRERPDGARAHRGAARCRRRRARRCQRRRLRRQSGCRVLPSRAHHRAARHRGGGATGRRELVGDEPTPRSPTLVVRASTARRALSGPRPMRLQNSVCTARTSTGGSAHPGDTRSREFARSAGPDDCYR